MIKSVKQSDMIIRQACTSYVSSKTMLKRWPKDSSIKKLEISHRLKYIVSFQLKRPDYIAECFTGVRQQCLTESDYHNTAFQTQRVTHNQSCYAVVFY